MFIYVFFMHHKIYCCYNITYIFYNSIILYTCYKRTKMKLNCINSELPTHEETHAVAPYRF